ncbi:S9 family peptidase, partial [archaeon]
VVNLGQAGGGGGGGREGDEEGEGEASAHMQASVNNLHHVLKYMIEKRFTTPNMLCVYGGGFHGCVLGVALTKFPSLFGSMYVEDGVYDMVRYNDLNPPYTDLSQGTHRPHTYDYTDTTWYGLYGHVQDGEGEMVRILNLSPIHNVDSLGHTAAMPSHASSHPAVYLHATLPPKGCRWGNSVHPAHSLRFAAQLQSVYGTSDALVWSCTMAAIIYIYLIYF